MYMPPIGSRRRSIETKEEHSSLCSDGNLIAIFDGSWKLVRTRSKPNRKVGSSSPVKAITAAMMRKQIIFYLIDP
jgi:hypothetical protein